MVFHGTGSTTEFCGSSTLPGTNLGHCSAARFTSVVDVAVFGSKLFVVDSSAQSVLLVDLGSGKADSQVQHAFVQLSSTCTAVFMLLLNPADAVTRVVGADSIIGPISVAVSSSGSYLYIGAVSPRHHIAAVHISSGRCLASTLIDVAVHGPAFSCAQFPSLTLSRLLCGCRSGSRVNG
jgi:hypothetical protein